MIQLMDKVYAIEVPSMAFGLMVNNYADESELMYMLSMSDIADDDSTEETLITKLLPPGSWRFLFTTKTATEEDAKKVVESERCKEIDKLYSGVFYKNYVPIKLQYWFDNAKESLTSLLRSKGLDLNKNYALIEKQSSDE